MTKIILKKFIVLFSLTFIFTGFNFVSAEDIHLDLIPCYNNSLNSEDLKTTPYCAILQSGIPNSWDWKWENSMGALLNSLNGVSGYSKKDESNNDVYYYWNWSLNSNSEFSALNKYELKKDDVVALTFTSSSDLVAPQNDTTINFIIDSIKTEEEPTKEIHHSSHSGSSGSSVAPIVITKKVFSIPNALEFLSKNENKDGAFGNSLYTDWAAIGVVKAGSESEMLKNKLGDYLKANELNSEIVTDNERRAMALMSLGINPYTGTKMNYIKKIIDSFDGTQIGDKSLYNDDIFALIVLSHAGYTDKDEMIAKIVFDVIKNQSLDGSWGSVDMTSAGIEALSNFKEVVGVSEVIKKAESYLLVQQKDDGSFGNISSTSWAIQALSLNESLKIETDKAIDYLADKQLEDGGLDQESIENRIWTTTYAIPAVLKLSWNEILELFPREETKISNTNEVITTRVETVNKNKVVEKKVLPKFIEKEVTEDNSLTASAGGSITNSESPNTSRERTFWQRVSTPFKWLFIKLGF